MAVDHAAGERTPTGNGVESDASHGARPGLRRKKGTRNRRIKRGGLRHTNNGRRAFKTGRWDELHRRTSNRQYRKQARLKRKRERIAARKAVADTDVTLPDPPALGIADDSPIPANPQERARRTLARKYRDRLLPQMPEINPLEFTIRYLPGGKTMFLQYVKLAFQNGDPVATAWWRVFCELHPSEQKHVNYGDICAGAGVKVSALLAAVVGHAVEASKDAGNLIAAAFHPAVIAAMGKSGLRLDSETGAEDRKLFLQGQQFLPVPKGASIHLHANASANSQAAAASSAEPSVPKFAADIASLAQSQSNVQRQLADATQDIIDVIAEPERAEA